MIGIFDSGIGGVTVLRELLKVLPKEDYLFYSDSMNNPYGDKDYDTLINITDNIVEYLIKSGCKVIVIACNTASSVCKDYLRNKYKIPIVAIEPAYKVVYDQAREYKTLVMATKATINSKNFQKLYNKYDNNNTTLCSCSGLADLIEAGDKNKIKEYLQKNIGKYAPIKNVVLGCTHYPLIKEEIKEVLGDVNFFDGSIGVSLEVKRVLEANNLLKNSSGKIHFIDSYTNKDREKLFFKLAQTGKI